MPEWAIQLITSTGITGVFIVYLWLKDRSDRAKDKDDREFRRQMFEHTVKQEEAFTNTINNHLYHSQLETQEFIKALDKLAETVDGVGEMVKKLNEIWENGG